MNVLLQGDVGAGKTLVALYAALVAIQSGHQAAIMAPTEVLAGQHLRSVAALLDGVGAMAFLDPGAGLGEGRRARFALGSRAGVPGRRVRHLRAPDRRRHRQGPHAHRGGDRRRRDRSDDRDACAGARGRVVPRPVARRDRRAASVRPAPADGAEGQGRRTGRADHDRHADPSDAGAHVLRRPGRDRARRDAEGAPADRDARGAVARGPRSGLRPGARRGRGGPAGVRGVRRDRRREPLAGEGRRGRGGAAGHRGLPGSPRRSAARPDAAEGQGGGDGPLPRGPRPTSSSRRR